MKFLYRFLISTFIFSFSFASLKLPDIIFPLEIIAVKKEEKERLKPPKYLHLLEKEKLDLFVNIPVSYPVNLKPLLGELKKPNAFLGIPKENAVVSSIMENFENGNFIIAQDKGKKFIKEYSQSKFLPDVYYILGLTYFELENFENAAKSFEKACSYDSYLKDYACISASVAYLQLGNLQKAKKFIDFVEFLPKERKFLEYVIKILNSKNFSSFSSLNCENLDIGFVEYCKYLNTYYLYSKKPEKFLQEEKPFLKTPYKKYIKLLEGFSYISLKKFDKAKTSFQNYIYTYGKSDIFSDYAIYGLLLSDLKKGNFSTVVEEIGSLEVRNKDLAQKIYILLGINSFERGDYVNSIAYFQRALNISQKNKYALKKYIGLSAYNLGFYKYAYNIFKTIKNPKYYLYTGFTLLNLNNFSEAKYYFKKAFKNAKSDKVKYISLKYLADIYYFNNEDTKFIAVLRQLKNFDTEYVSNMLGWYFFKLKEYQKAYESFTDVYMKAVSAFNMGNDDLALKIINDRFDRKSKFLKAYIYLKRVNLKKAREILKQLSKGNDKIAKEAGYLYAYSFFSNGEYKKAAEEFEKYYKKYKDTYLGKRALLRMADSLYNIGKKEEAKKIYSDFMKKYAGTKEAIDAAYLLTVLETKETTANVEKQILNFVKKYPDYPEVNLLKLQLADIYYHKGNKDEAIKILKEIILKDIPESEQALYKLGYYYYSQKNFEKSKETLIRYVLKYPDGKFVVPSKQILADIYEKNGEYKKAIKLYKELPQTDETKYKIALLYFKTKDYFNAKKLFEELYKKYPKYKNDIAYFLAIIAYGSGDLELAKKYFEEAIKGSDYKRVAQSYFILGNIYKKLGNIEEALNSYINVVYLYSQEKDYMVKSRVEAAKILEKQGKRIEAACMLEPLKSMENINEDVIKLINTLPKCIK